MRTKYLNPDFRRNPKTSVYCCACQKDLKPGQRRRWVHCIQGGMTVLHPEDEALYVPDGADLGCHPIGMDCAKKLGLEWTFESPAMDELLIAYQAVGPGRDEMTEGKHTPGPWSHAGRKGGWDGVDASDGTNICHLEYNNPANASLIAATPDLLAALEMIRDIASGSRTINSLGHIERIAVEVIAKATAP